MNHNKMYLAAIITFSAACGAVEAPSQETGNAYQTTSNIGDLATWTIDGDQMHVEWQDIAPITGEVEQVYSLDAICGAIDSQFGHRDCAISGDVICTPVTSACAPGTGPQSGDVLTTLEVPGVALIVNAANDELHTGFAAGGCQDIATDDYSFVNVGLGQKEAIGLFRTDSSFSTVHHMDFDYTDAPENKLRYATRDVGGLVAGISVSACENGVRELFLEEEQVTMRLIVTEAGHFVLDKPEGQGGLLAVNSANAAVVEDFANKEFGGIVFPDDRAPELISLTTGAAAGGRALVTSIVLSESGALPMPNAVYINDGSAGSSLKVAPLDGQNSYASNQLVVDGSYPAGPSQLPGIFEIDPVSGDETAILGVGATVDGKTVLFGAVVNEFEGDENAIKGNFVLVEK